MAEAPRTATPSSSTGTTSNTGLPAGWTAYMIAGEGRGSYIILACNTSHRRLTLALVTAKSSSLWRKLSPLGIRGGHMDTRRSKRFDGWGKNGEHRFYTRDLSVYGGSSHMAKIDAVIRNNSWFWVAPSSITPPPSHRPFNPSLVPPRNEGPSMRAAPSNRRRRRVACTVSGVLSMPHNFALKMTYYKSRMNIGGGAAHLQQRTAAQVAEEIKRCRRREGPYA